MRLEEFPKGLLGQATRLISIDIDTVKVKLSLCLTNATP
jgi:hypothetical protein